MKYYIGVDLGGTNIACGVVTQDGKLLARHSVLTARARPAEEIIADMVAASNEAIKMAGIDWREIEGLGIGVPGAVNDATGMVLRTTNLDWYCLPLAKIIQQKVSVPVHLGNDADCAALGEVVSGCASKYSSAAMITIGTGIGGGLICDKKVFAGWAGGGTEPGHIPLLLGGEPCGCGNQGCFEAYASATALTRQTKRAMQENSNSALWRVAPLLEEVNAKTPFDAALLNDTTAIAVLDRYEEYLAAGIGGIVNLVRPEAIIIGGGVSRQGDTLLIPLREKLKKYCYASEFIAPPVVVSATLGNDAGIIGAAMLAR